MKLPNIITRIVTRRRAIDAACLLTLAALALMIWSLFDPRPIPIVVAMSVGQGLGTLAFVLYLGVLVVTLQRAHVLEDDPPETREP